MEPIINTELFREPAISFQKRGYYTDAPEGTKEYEDYWDEQAKRCLDGFSVGGKKITGYHYFYLNFTRIKRFSDEVLHTDKKVRTADKIFTFPAFWDWDYTWFWLVEIGRYGIDLETYKKIGLGVDVPEDSLDGGYHMSCLKARGRGYSWKMASMYGRNFFLKKRTKNYAFAGDKKYLRGDALLDKFDDVFNHNNEYCAWRQPLLIDKPLEKKTGYKQIEGGKPISKGTLNEIIGISFAQNKDAGRGKRGELIGFEEAGSFPNLLAAWEITKKSVEQGDIRSGIMIAFGTGGSKGDDIQGLEELYRNPEAYGILPMYNQWEAEFASTTTGFFVPVYTNKDGYMDPDGNSDIEKAVRSEEKERGLKKKGRVSAYNQYIAENPMIPSEALMSIGSNVFPTKALQEQKTRVLSMKTPLGVNGSFVNSEGKIKFISDPDAIPVDHYPHKSNEPLEGCGVMWEAPIRYNDNIPDNLYYIAHDPFALENAADKTSIGSAYVMKRSVNIDTFPDLPVCSFNGRPDTLDKYNEQLFLMAQYYNARIGFENDRGDVIPYARKNRMLHLLQTEFEFTWNKELQSENVNRKYGVHMTTDRKHNGITYLAEWIDETIHVDGEGNKTKRYHYIYDIGLLEELIKFNSKGNFDRVSALIVAMFFKKELEPVKADTAPRRGKMSNFMKKAIM